MKTARNRKGWISNPNLAYQAEPREVKLRKIINGESNDMEDGVFPIIYTEKKDGIGYQDLIQEQMVGETSVYENSSSISKMKHLAANKTVAWIDYMTDYNRTFGDFAAGEALDFMVLNRRYEVI